MSRPLFGKTTEELVQLFEQSRESAETLRILADELSKRHSTKSRCITKTRADRARKVGDETS